jgi:hypothetical protein
VDAGVVIIYGEAKLEMDCYIIASTLEGGGIFMIFIIFHNRDL